MRTSAVGIDLIKKYEGYEFKAYKDFAKGVLTIGWGHTGPDVEPGQTITMEEADEILARDLRPREAAIGRLIDVALNQNEFDALVSFVYNLGAESLSRSTLRRRLNKNNRRAAALWFPKWNKARVNGKLIPVLGLTRRRNAEMDLFLKPFTK